MSKEIWYGWLSKLKPVLGVGVNTMCAAINMKTWRYI
jgi:hypothetical protein